MSRLNNALFLLVVLSGCNGAVDIHNEIQEKNGRLKSAREISMLATTNLRLKYDYLDENETAPLEKHIEAFNHEKYFKICSRNALDANDCIADAVRKGIVTMIDGIPELGVPPIDPYLQKDFKLDYNNNQLQARIVLKNTYVEGLKKAIVKDARLRADDDKFHLEVDLTAPSVKINTEFRGEGKFNQLHLLAFGTINTTMADLTYTWKLDGVPEKRGTDTYIRIKEFYMRPDVGSMFTTLTNLNPESRELTDLGVTFTNANWRVLYKELLPYAQANWNKIGTRIANKIFSKVPYDQLFPTS